MAASLMGIMELVWVNISNSTTANQARPPCQPNPSEHSKATPALQRNSLTRSPVWSLSQPQA